MPSLDQALRGHPFLSGMPSERIKTLTDCAFEMQFAAGQFIFRQGEDANRFYLIKEGRVALEASSPTHGVVLIQTLDGGEVLGWSWLIPPYRWYFDARSIAPTSAVAFDAKIIRERAEEDHDFGFDLMKRIARIMQERLQATRIQLMGLFDVHL